MNAVGNQRLGVAYKSDDDLYNTKYKIEYAADQGYPPNLLIGLDGSRVACRIDDVKKPRLAVRQKYAISVPFRLASTRAVFLVLAWTQAGEFQCAVKFMSPSNR